MQSCGNAMYISHLFFHCTSLENNVYDPAINEDAYTVEESSFLIKSGVT